MWITNRYPLLGACSAIGASYKKEVTMVRDVRHQTITGYLESYKVCPNGETLQFTLHGGAAGGFFQKHYDQRDDLTPSDHVLSTSYGAQRYSAEAIKWNQLNLTRTICGFGPNGWIMGNERQEGIQGFYPDYYFGLRESDPYDVNFPDWVVKSSRGKVLSALINSDVNIGNFLGELPETGKFIAGSAITVLQAFKALKKGQYRRIPKLLGVSRKRDLPKSAAGVWFAYKFGWKPFLEDIFNAHGEVMKQINRPKFHRVTRTTSTQTLHSNPFKGQVIDAKKGCKVGVAYRIGNETLAGLNSVGLINPASVAWELLPLSFVVDWFLPIGNFLEQISAPIGLDFVTGYETRFAYGDLNVVTRRVQSGWVGSEGKVRVKTFGFRRSKLITWPKPTLSFRFELNLDQIATAIGLIFQRIRI
jgi:hypothetical protein